MSHGAPGGSDAAAGQSDVVRFLSRLRAAGLRLELEGERLRYSAPRGRMTPELLAELRARKPEVIAFLREAARAASAARPPAARAPAGRPISLSLGQERLWFLEQLEGPSAVYTLPMQWRLDGPLSASALADALGELSRRHEVLRSAYPEVDGRPTCVLRPAEPFALPLVDLAGVPSARREAVAERVAAAAVAEPFDLARGPLWRALLLRLGPLRHLFVLTIHHIVSDAWSMGIVIRELGALYADAVRGRPAALPEPPFQYRDFAHMQRAWVDGPAVRDQLARLKARLSGAPPLLDLPLDLPRPEVQRFRGGTCPVRIPDEDVEAFRRMARDAEATLYMAFLSAFAGLLARHTGQDDVVVGSPIADRHLESGLEALVGFFVNLLPLRIDLSGDPSALELIRRVRGAALDAFADRDVPFERLVDELQPVRDLRHTPIFQSLFVLQNAPAVRPGLPGLDVEGVRLDRVTAGAAFDLTLSLEEVGRGVRGGFEYDRSLFEPDTIERLARRFETLVGEIAHAPERPLSRLARLPEAEYRRVVREWNDTATTPVGVGDAVHAWIAAQAERTPDATAVIAPEGALRYGELSVRSGDMASRLRAAGVGPETPVAVHLERSLDFAVALVGVLAAGGVYVPLDPEHPAARRALVLDDTGARVLVARRGAGGVPEGFAGAVLDPAESRGARSDPASCQPLVSPEQAAYVIYTSGSTGRPKGVVNTHRGLANRLRWMQRAYGLDASDRVLHKTPVSFDVSVWELLWPLFRGAALVLARPGGHRDPAYLHALCAGEGVTTLHFVPSMLHAFLDGAPDEPLPALRRIVCSGEALPSDLAARCRERFGAALFNLYGPTEAAIDVTAAEADGTARGPTVPIGRPIDNTRCYVLDRRGQPVPIGVAGELFLAGDGLARGYRGQAARTAERFVPDPFAPEPGGRLYRTGDRVRALADGRLEFLGRLDHQIKIRGVRVEPGEIEAALRRYPGVEDAVVVPHERGGDLLLVAHVAHGSGRPPEVSGLRAWLARLLPDFMLPSAFVALARLPLAPNGKVDRRALPAPPEPEAGAAYTAAASATEEVVAALFAQVLGVSRVGRDDDFFALGGHSLLAIRLLAHLRELWPAGLSVRDLFQASTVGALAARLDDATRGVAAADAAIEPRSRPASLPLSFAQERFYFLDRLDPGSTVLHLPLGLRLDGPLCVASLAQAFDAVVARHEALRTVFPASGGEARQVILEPAPFALSVVDLRALPEPRRSETAQQLATREVRRPFDLATGPLLRALAVRVRPDRHLLVITLHHIVSDGWSLRVVLRELAAAYAALVRGAAPALGRPPLQYADFALWQIERFGRGAFEADLAYWKTRFASPVPPLALGRRPADARATGRGAVAAQTLPALLAERVRALARREGATLFMTLLAAFLVVLGRRTGARDVVVGTPVSQRGRPETEGVVGCFVNMVPLRVRLSEGLDFSELVARVRRTALAAYSHAGLPFEKLIEALRPEREDARMPLFRVDLTLHEAPEEGFTLPGISAARHPLDTGAARFDLTLLVEERSDGLLLAWEHATDCLDAAAVRALQDELRALLDEVTPPADAAGRGAADARAPSAAPP